MLKHLRAEISFFLLGYAPRLYSFISSVNSSGFRKWRRRDQAVVRHVERHARILVIDHDFPEPDRDAGSRAMFSFVRMVHREFCDVVFWGDTYSPSSAGKAGLQAIGVETASPVPGMGLAEWLQSFNSRDFKTVVLSRPIVARKLIGGVRGFGAERIVYYGHDIHYRRLLATSRQLPSLRVSFAAGAYRRIEHALWRCADAVLYPAQNEVNEVDRYRHALGVAGNGHLMPLWSIGSDARNASPASRKGVLFVGSLGHQPNSDGLNWFFREVLALLRTCGCDAPIYLVGSGIEKYKVPNEDAGIFTLGHLSDSDLEKLYAAVKCTIVPLRFGAGIKGKVLESLAHGVPCVTTSTGLQGLETAGGFLEPNDEPAAFAKAIHEAIRDERLWEEKSRAGSRFMQIHYSDDVMRGKLETVLQLRSTAPSRDS